MIIDISPLVSARIAVWPGDTPLSREVLCDMKQGDNLTLSTLHATVHLGAHADAPSHYGRDAASIEARSLDPYLGTAQVVTVACTRGRRFGPEALAHEISAPRVLLRTRTFPDPEHFNEDFAAPEPGLVDWLVAHGVRLIGVDTPSMDLFDSKDLPTHQRCLALDVALLEGLVLDRVADGHYELIALPLRLEGFDASPVRAVLRPL